MNRRLTHPLSAKKPVFKWGLPNARRFRDGFLTCYFEPIFMYQSTCILHGETQPVKSWIFTVKIHAMKDRADFEINCAIEIFENWDFHLLVEYNGAQLKRKFKTGKRLWEIAMNTATNDLKNAFEQPIRLMRVETKPFI